MPRLETSQKTPPLGDGIPHLAARVHARLETALEKAKEILQQNRDRPDALVEELFNMQWLNGDEVFSIIEIARY